MTDASLVLVGSGIKFISHLTTEAKTYITQSDKVLYLVNEPVMKAWIRKNHPSTESLDDLYNSCNLRIDSYKEITKHILVNVRRKQHVCVVLYGHPTVFSKPGLNSVIQARKEGYYAKILPGISAEACLFADLLIDPGSSGCMSFEATDLLIYKRTIDITCHLVVWQISVIGNLRHSRAYDNSNGIRLLLEYLFQYYPRDHSCILYTAAQYPGLAAIITPLKLSELPKASFSRISTLYIPPADKGIPDLQMLDRLGINISY